jgi:ABC-2 type transport system ATP-binding protein
MDIAVEAKDLFKKYGDLIAVNKVSFTIQEGEIFGLLGPNGAGKTTTIEMIEGLRKPDGGSIQLCGIDVRKRADNVKEIIGVQLQSTSFMTRSKSVRQSDFLAVTIVNLDRRTKSWKRYP